MIDWAGNRRWNDWETGQFHQKVTRLHPEGKERAIDLVAGMECSQGRWCLGQFALRSLSITRRVPTFTQNVALELWVVGGQSRRHSVDRTLKGGNAVSRLMD